MAHIAEQDAVVNQAINFNIDDVTRRYAKDYALPLSVAQEHERELKRFLALCALKPTVDYGMKGPVDDLWHTFIIFTRSYAEFCDLIAGRFLHHTPADGAEGPESGSYVKMLQDYEAFYRETPPVHIWPRPLLGAKEGADCGSDCDFTGCSQKCGCTAACKETSE